MSIISQKSKKVNSNLPPEFSADKRWLPKAFLTMISCLPEREREIILLRSGVLSSEPMTLAEVGEVHHLTKERVRVIEKVAFDKKMANEVQELVTLVEKAVQGEEELLKVGSKRLEKFVPGSSAYPELFAYLLEKSPSPRKVANSLGVICELREAEILKFRNQASKVIKKRCLPGQGYTRADAENMAKVALFKTIKGVADIEATVSTITKLAMNNFSFSDEGIYLGSAHSESSRVLDILQTSPHPLSIKEISETLNKEAPPGEKGASLTYIRNICIENPLILNLGPSLFGTEKHIKISPDTKKKIEKALVNLVKSSGKVSVHHEEAYDYLIDKGILRHGDIASYKDLILVTLNSSKLTYLGYHIFTIKENEEQAKGSQRSISHDIESILESAGKPMDGKLILDELRKRRVLRSNFQIAAWGRIAPYGKDWGLIGRDLPYSQVKAKQFANDVREKLEANKSLPLESAIKMFKSIFKWDKDFEPQGFYLASLARGEGVACRYTRGAIQRGYVKRRNKYEATT